LICINFRNAFYEMIGQHRASISYILAKLYELLNGFTKNEFNIFLLAKSLKVDILRFIQRGEAW